MERVYARVSLKHSFVCNVRILVCMGLEFMLLAKCLTLCALIYGASLWCFEREGNFSGMHDRTMKETRHTCHHPCGR